MGTVRYLKVQISICSYLGDTLKASKTIGHALSIGLLIPDLVFPGDASFNNGCICMRARTLGPPGGRNSKDTKRSKRLGLVSILIVVFDNTLSQIINFIVVRDSHTLTTIKLIYSEI